MAALHEDREHLGIIRLLLRHGADPKVKTSEGETVLHLAIGSVSRVQVFLELAPLLDVNAQDDQGRSALHHAAMMVLIDSGANVKLRDFGGASTLHYAVGHSACVRLAIQKGISTKAVDFRKRTALHYFRMIERFWQEQEGSDQIDVLHQLQEAGVDPDAIDTYGKKASEYYRGSSVDIHGFEETALWIGMQPREGRYVVQGIQWLRDFREANIKALRDGPAFYEEMKREMKERKWWIVPDDQAPTNSSG